MENQLTHNGLYAQIDNNVAGSFFVFIVQDVGTHWMGQQVIKARNYKSMKAAQRGAIKMLEALS